MNTYRQSVYIPLLSRRKTGKKNGYGIKEGGAAGFTTLNRAYPKLGKKISETTRDADSIGGSGRRYGINLKS